MILFRVILRLSGEAELWENEAAVSPCLFYPRARCLIDAGKQSPF